MERTNAVVRGESTFGKDEDGFAVAKEFFHLFRLTKAGSSRRCDRTRVTHLLQECSDEGHMQHFDFGDEVIRDAEAKHQRQNIEIAGVICGVDFSAGRVHVFLADDADAAANQREQEF